MNSNKTNFFILRSLLTMFFMSMLLFALGNDLSTKGDFDKKCLTRNIPDSSYNVSSVEDEIISLTNPDSSLLEVFSEDGLKFFLVLNGIKQNVSPQENVKVAISYSTNLQITIVFEDETIQYLLQYTLNNTSIYGNHCVMKILRNREGKYELKPLSTPIPRKRNSFGFEKTGGYVADDVGIGTLGYRFSDFQNGFQCVLFNYYYSDLIGIGIKAIKWDYYPSYIISVSNYGDLSSNLVDGDDSLHATSNVSRPEDGIGNSVHVRHHNFSMINAAFLIDLFDFDLDNNHVSRQILRPFNFRVLLYGEVSGVDLMLTKLPFAWIDGHSTQDKAIDHGEYSSSVIAPNKYAVQWKWLNSVEAGLQMRSSIFDLKIGYYSNIRETEFKAIQNYGTRTITTPHLGTESVVGGKKIILPQYGYFFVEVGFNFNWHK
ncbi:MAG: hypothetical protein PHT69_12165 [Bacteroidales bacterium]|nr:hypothetical protein [Bacteroidales bacterium]